MNLLTSFRKHTQGKVLKCAKIYTSNVTVRLPVDWSVRQLLQFNQELAELELDEYPDTTPATRYSSPGFSVKGYTLQGMVWYMDGSYSTLNFHGWCYHLDTQIPRDLYDAKA